MIREIDLDPECAKTACIFSDALGNEGSDSSVETNEARSNGELME